MFCDRKVQMVCCHLLDNLPEKLPSVAGEQYPFCAGSHVHIMEHHEYLIEI